MKYRVVIEASDEGFDALEHPRGPDFIGPLTRAATGLVDLDAASSDADLLGEALRERYGDAR
jgi:hypothetical protein